MRRGVRVTPKVSSSLFHAPRDACILTKPTKIERPSGLLTVGLAGLARSYPASPVQRPARTGGNSNDAYKIGYGKRIMKTTPSAPSRVLARNGNAALELSAVATSNVSDKPFLG